MDENSPDKLLEQLKSEWESALKPINDRIEEETKKYGEATAETKAICEKVNDRLDEIEARFEKASLDTKPEAEDSVARKAFAQFCRKGLDKLGPDEVKVLNVSDDTEGGFLAPAELVNEIVKGVMEYSPLRELATVRQTSRNSVKAPKRTQAATASWVSEQGTRSETTNPKYGMEEIPTHELYALADVTFAELEDAAFNIESILRDEFSEAFGTAEGTALITGNAVGRPEGILSNAEVIAAATTSNSNDALNSDDFIDLLYALKEPYHRNATWLLNRLVVRDARKLKDQDDQYLWQPALAADVPATILGQPYRMATDMPVVADGAYALAVGDFKKAYWLVDRIQLAVQRDPYTQASSGAVRFHARKRVGGQVVVPEAIKILTIY